MSKVNNVWVHALDNGRIDKATHFSTFSYRRLTPNESPMVWCNRSADINGDGSSPNTSVYKGNWYEGIFRSATHGETRPQFTTVNRADAATRITLARLLGYPDTFLTNLASQAGITWYNHSDLDISSAAALAEEYINGGVTRWYLVDKVIVPAKPSHRPTSVMFDYEVHDSRSPADVIRLITQLRRDVRSTRKMIWFTNSLRNVSTRVRNGYNMHSTARLMSSADYVAPVVWTGATVGNPSREIPGRPREWSPTFDFSETLRELGQGSAAVVPFLSGFDITDDEIDRIKVLSGGTDYGIWRNYTSWEECQRVIDRLSVDANSAAA